MAISRALSGRSNDGPREKYADQESHGRGPRADRRFTLRAAVSGMLVILAVLLMPVAATGWWVRSTLSDTDSYLAIVGPLVDDPALQDAAANAISQAAVEQLDVGDKIDSGAEALGNFVRSDKLGDLLAGFKDPVQDGALQAVTTAVGHVMASDALARVWRTAHATAHHQALLVVEGRSDLAKTENGVVRLELGPVVALVLNELGVINPPVADVLQGLDASVPLFSLAGLEDLQSQYQFLMRTTLAIPALAAALMLLGVALARHRPRTFLVFALLAGTLLVTTPLVADVLSTRLRPSNPEGHIFATAITDAAHQPLQSLCYLLAGVLLAVGATGVTVSHPLGHLASTQLRRPARTRPPS